MDDEILAPEEAEFVAGLRWQIENAGGCTLEPDEIEMLVALIDRLVGRIKLPF